MSLGQRGGGWKRDISFPTKHRLSTFMAFPVVKMRVTDSASRNRNTNPLIQNEISETAMYLPLKSQLQK